jgi:Ca2+-dependent lipid-binding protein
MQLHTHAILGERISVKLTVIRGAGLVAKDRNMIGQKTSSDPYVEAYAKTNKMVSTFFGKTATIGKTVNPIWNERFDLEPRRENPKVTLKIFDEDFMSEPDAMGIVTIEIPTKPGDTTKWYDIPESSAKNASGKLQVRVQTAMVPTPEWRIEYLETEVDRLTGELSKTNIAAPKAGRNSLEPTVEFLNQEHKDLLKQRMQLGH